VNQRAICPNAAFPAVEIQERVPASETIRTFRTTLGLLGDGFVEAVDDSTLINISNRQCKQDNGKICGLIVRVPILESPGETRLGRLNHDLRVPMGPRAHCSRRCMGGPQVTSGVAVQTRGVLRLARRSETTANELCDRDHRYTSGASDRTLRFLILTVWRGAESRRRHSGLNWLSLWAGCERARA